MGINVIDDEKAKQALIGVENQTVKDLTGQVLPVLFSSAQAIIDATVLNLQKTLADFVNGLDAVKVETFNELDGWTLTIQPIVIKLERGKKDA